ncbi:DUF2073 domain-containing protein [Candidatus Woesearchaeota archaeon]|nr:DUF2073 domain-containing protein [Candidatus Woesearchaeota archaeon]
MALTLQFVPYADIESLDSESRIGKLLGIVKNKNVVLMEGRLKPGEETLLIQKTMEAIDKEFKGVELCTIFPEDRNLAVFRKIRKNFTSFLLGNREGLTIIGPATVVKEIRRDPNKIQLFTVDVKRR